MATQNQVYNAKRLAEDIHDVTDGDQATDRMRLATVYEIVIAVESYLPRPGLSFKPNTARTLRKAVCRYCPSKVKPKAMEHYVEQAKTQLRSYLSRLQAWIEENDKTQDHGGEGIHQLNSTL